MPSQPTYSFFPLGDSALLLDFGNTMDEGVNRLVLKLFYGLRRLSLPGITDIVPAYSSLAVFYDLDVVGQNRNGYDNVYEKMCTLLTAVFENMPQDEGLVTRQHRIPVCYDPPFAPDMDEISETMNIDRDEIIRLHTGRSYRVFMIGFLPGFAYMGEVDQRIAMPRKKEPRTGLARGSVGIAGSQTGIYPFDSPGGWQIIGRTPMLPFDPAVEKPVLFSPGDTVSFYSISTNEFENYEGRTV